MRKRGVLDYLFMSSGDPMLCGTSILVACLPDSLYSMMGCYWKAIH